MFVRTWFDSLTSRPARQQARRRTPAADRRLAARKLLLEGLEDRRLMAFDVLAEMTTGSGPHHLELAAIDSDSQLDLVTVESARVVVRLGNADGSFGDPLAATGEVVANSALTGDFTDDGVTDLVTNLNGQVSLRIGNGEGSFQDPLSLGLPWQWESAALPVPAFYGQNVNSLVAGDLNEDGKLDLVLGGSTFFPYGIACGYYSCGYTFTSNGYVNVLLGTGTGSFDYVDADPSDPELSAYPGSTNSLAIDDLNNDGHLDVLGGYGRMTALLGNGTGTLQAPVHSGSGTVFSSISLGDLDGDGNLDTVTQNGNNLIVQKGQGDGSFVQGAVLDAGQTLQSATIGDVDGDGNLDLVAAGSAHCAYYGPYGYGCYDTTHARQASVLLGNGQGGFSLPIFSTLGTVSDVFPSLSSLKLADLTGDGLLDLVTVDRQAVGKVIVASNDGNWAAPEELAIADVTVVEGDSGSTSAVFTVTLTGDPGGLVTVDFVSFDYDDLGALDAARAGEDYTPQAGTLSFGPGVLSRTITVPIFGDRLGEGNETFFVNLSNPAGALLRDAEAVGTIVDNEPGISIDHPFGSDPLTVVEGDSGTTPAVFTVSLTRPYDQEVTVDYYTSTGHTNDILAASGTLRFAPGQTSQTITVQVVNDLIYEDLEAFNVYLTNPSPHAAIANGAGYCYIEDNDPPAPAISISDAEIVEGNNGSRTMTFTVSLSAASSQTVRVSYKTADGTARTGNKDYASKSGTLQFAPGETSKTVTVTIKGDRKQEADEYLFVNLSGAIGAEIADGQGVGTIRNDDGGVRLSKWIATAAAVDAVIADWMFPGWKGRNR